MKERPILFSAPMVRAILAGNKTVTRRVAKPQPVEVLPAPAGSRGFVHETCPYGQPGDRLWVRETCRAEELPDGMDGVRYIADGAFREIENSTAASEAWCVLNAYRGKRGAVVPTIHMPRWASRITLEVTGMRVERLQDISEADAKAEGCAPAWLDAEDNETVHADRPPAYRQGFARLWRDINGPASWDANPWVWVVEFKRIPQEQAA